MLEASGSCVDRQLVATATIRLAPLLPTRCAVVNFPSVKDAVAAATEMYVSYLLVRINGSDSLLYSAGFTVLGWATRCNVSSFWMI